MRGVGVEWVRTLTHTYDVAGMRDTLREALTTKEKGPKVIVAQSECMLNKQRRERPLMAKAIKGGERVVRERFGVDADTCTGDHSCIRLSGCPSLTVAPNPDPLRTEPVTKVINSCVGCGLCGEVAHAAVLCPSFYRASIINNPSSWDRLRARVRNAVIGFLQRRIAQTPVRVSMNAPFPQRQRPITIAILAMGGEGGGVLADWIVDLAEHNRYLAQLTSVPGVAQRTGATIYYLEIYPRAAIADSAHEPVLALMPVPGDVDIVIASELMEAGRAIQRGLITPDRTTLIASTNRVFSMTERIAMSDGRVDDGKLAEACRAAAKTMHAFDMAALAEATGSVISAVLLGALAGAGVLPFPRQAFEGAIKRGGKGIQASLAAFTAGFEATTAGVAAVKMPATVLPPPTLDGQDSDETPTAPSPHKPIPAELLRESETFPASARAIVRAGIERTVDYQGLDYAKLYLNRLAPIAAADKDGRLVTEAARQLALGMAYEDTIRVAELKIRPSRFERVREEVQVNDNQILEIAEFMHPRTQEIADTLPAPLGRFILEHRLGARSDRSDDA